MKKVYYCPKCFESNYHLGYRISENSTCQKHNIKMQEPNIDVEDFNSIIVTTKFDGNCVSAMIKLKEEDPIEYQLKMAQFRELARQKHENFEEACRKSEEEQTKPKCPRCGSTSITTGARGVNNFWGFLGASKTVNRCGNCGHTWTPR